MRRLLQARALGIAAIVLSVMGLAIEAFWLVSLGLVLIAAAGALGVAWELKR